MKKFLFLLSAVVLVLHAEARLDMGSLCVIENGLKNKKIDSITLHGGCVQNGNTYHIKRIVLQKGFDAMMAKEPAVQKVGKQQFVKLLKHILKRQDTERYCQKIGLQPGQSVDVAYVFDNGGTFTHHTIDAASCRKSVTTIPAQSVIAYFERLKGQLPLRIGKNVSLTDIAVDKSAKRVRLTYSLRDRKNALSDAQAKRNFEKVMQKRLAQIIKNNAAFSSIVHAGWTFAMQVRTDKGYMHTFTYTKADI